MSLKKIMECLQDKNFEVDWRFNDYRKLWIQLSLQYNFKWKHLRSFGDWLMWILWNSEIRDSWGKATFNRHLKYRVFLIIFGLWTFFVSVYCLVVKEGRLRFSHFWPSISLSIRNSSSMEPVFWSFLAKGLATFIERI